MNNTGVCGLFVIVYYLLSVVTIYFTATVSGNFNINVSTPDFRAISSCIASFVSGTVGVLIYFASGRFKSYRQTCFQKPKPTALFALVPISLVIWLCGMFVNVLINKYAYSFFDITPISQLPTPSSPQIYAVNFLNVCIIAPIMEELLFRGALIDNAKGYGVSFAVVISSVMFAFAHGSITVFGLPLVMGIVSAMVLAKTGCVFYCIFIHAICNGTSFIMSCLPQTESVYLIENLLVLVGGGVITGMAIILNCKRIIKFFKNAIVQSGKYFCSGTEVIALVAIVLYYIYSNYSLHFMD